MNKPASLPNPMLPLPPETTEPTTLEEAMTSSTPPNPTLSNTPMFQEEPANPEISPSHPEKSSTSPTNLPTNPQNQPVPSEGRQTSRMSPTPGGDPMLPESKLPFVQTTAKAEPSESHAALQQALEVLHQLEESFRTRIQIDESKKNMIEAMQSELREHRAGLIAGIMRPVYHDLIRLIDDFARLAKSWGQRESLDAGGLLQALEGVPQDLQDVLERYGVTPFTSAAEDYDPKSQHAIKRIPTDNPALGQKIAERLRAGYRVGDQILRPELVNIYVRINPAAPTAAI